MNPIRPRLAMLISGGGTTLQNFIDRISDGRMIASIVGVISSRPDAFGVTRAERAGLNVAIVPKGDRHSERVFETVRRFQPDLVCLAGWLHLLSIPSDWSERVLNIHPSLLPDYGGKGMYGQKVHEAVISNHESESGCTVHYADNSYDTGPIIGQARVPVQASDTPATLAARVFEAECELYPDAIHRVWKNQISRSADHRVG